MLKMHDKLIPSDSLSLRQQTAIKSSVNDTNETHIAEKVTEEVLWENELKEWDKTTDEEISNEKLKQVRWQLEQTPNKRIEA